MKEFSVAYQPKTYSDFIAAAYAKYIEHLGYELPGTQFVRESPEPLHGPPEQVAATVKVVEITTELIPKPPRKLVAPKAKQNGIIVKPLILVWLTPDQLPDGTDSFGTYELYKRIVNRSLSAAGYEDCLIYNNCGGDYIGSGGRYSSIAEFIDDEYHGTGGKIFNILSGDIFRGSNTRKIIELPYRTHLDESTVEVFSPNAVILITVGAYSTDITNTAQVINVVSTGILDADDEDLTGDGDDLGRLDPLSTPESIAAASIFKDLEFYQHIIVGGKQFERQGSSSPVCGISGKDRKVSYTTSCHTIEEVMTDNLTLDFAVTIPKS